MKGKIMSPQEFIFRHNLINFLDDGVYTVKLNDKNIDDLIANIGKIGYLPEGAVACKYVYEVSEKKGLKLTLCDGLYKILNKEIRPMDFLDAILNLGKVNA